MEINFILGYVEKNCSVRCYTMLKNAIKRFKIKYTEQLTVDRFNLVDIKSSKEYFAFLQDNKSKLVF